MSELTSREKDLGAIDAVNERDVQFALANDSEKMMSRAGRSGGFFSASPTARGRFTVG
jgi:hypothetical protein